MSERREWCKDIVVVNGKFQFADGMPWFTIPAYWKLCPICGTQRPDILADIAKEDDDFEKAMNSPAPKEGISARDAREELRELLKRYSSRIRSFYVSDRALDEILDWHARHSVTPDPKSDKSTCGPECGCGIGFATKSDKAGELADLAKKRIQRDREMMNAFILGKDKPEDKAGEGRKITYHRDKYTKVVYATYPGEVITYDEKETLDLERLPQ